MASLSLSHTQMYDVYCKEVRSILEYGVAVWHPGLTRKDSMEIERIQRLAFQMILKTKYVDYKMACIYFKTTTLAERREKLCLTFATRNLKCKNSFFDPIEPKSMNTRARNGKVKSFKCRTARYEKSSLPYMAKLLNR